MNAVDNGQDKKYRLSCLVLGGLGANCYILADKATAEAVVIDPGGEAGRVMAALDGEKARLTAIINTHGHWDHVAGNKRLKELSGAPLLIHRLDAPMLGQGRLNLSSLFGEAGQGGEADRLLEDGDIIEAGELKLQVIHTPGHTLGGICLLCEDLLFTGDTLFQLSVGRCDLPGGNEATLMRSLQEKLAPLDKDLLVLPGHGPESNLAYEIKYNPYFPR